MDLFCFFHLQQTFTTHFSLHQSLFLLSQLRMPALPPNPVFVLVLTPLGFLVSVFATSARYPLIMGLPRDGPARLRAETWVLKS